MSIRNEVWTDIAWDVWVNYEMEIFNRLKAKQPIHGNKFIRIKMEMERDGCPNDHADTFIQDQLNGMYVQIAEQAEAS